PGCRSCSMIRSPRATASRRPPPRLETRQYPLCAPQAQLQRTDASQEAYRMMVNSPSPACLAGRAAAAGLIPISRPRAPRPGSKHPELEADVDRQHDYDDDHREDAQDERDRQLGGQAVGLLLGDRHALVAHVVAVDAERVGQARSELLRLLQQGGERARLLEAEPVGEPFE